MQANSTVTSFFSSLKVKFLLPFTFDNVAGKSEPKDLVSSIKLFLVLSLLTYQWYVLTEDPQVLQFLLDKCHIGLYFNSSIKSLRHQSVCAWK